MFLIYSSPSELFSMGAAGLFNRMVSNAPILLTVPLLALYDGTYGNSPVWFRKLYRWFYPAHLWILTAFAV